MKICKPDLLSKLLARFIGIGINFFRFDYSQVDIEDDKIILKADFQRKIYNDQFVFYRIYQGQGTTTAGDSQRDLQSPVLRYWHGEGYREIEGSIQAREGKAQSSY